MPPSQVASSTDVVEGTAVKDEKQYLLKEEEGRDAGGRPDITGPRGRAGPTPSPSLYRIPPTFLLKWSEPTPQWRGSRVCLPDPARVSFSRASIPIHRSPLLKSAIPPNPRSAQDDPRTEEKGVAHAERAFRIEVRAIDPPLSHHQRAISRPRTSIDPVPLLLLRNLTSLGSEHIHAFGKRQF